MYHRSSVATTAVAGIVAGIVTATISRSSDTTTPIATHVAVIVPTVVIESSAFRPPSFLPRFFFEPFVLFNVV